MTVEQWVYLFLILCASFTAYKIGASSIRYKSLPHAFFTGASVSLAISCIFLLFKGLPPTGVEWANLVSIILAICGLFAMVRESKPVFARFPVYMVFLPLLSIFFYPLTIDAKVIKDLIIASYQGGALAVALLFLITENIKQQKKEFYTLSGVTICIASFVLYWFVKTPEISTQSIALILLGTGLFLIAAGFSKRIRLKNTP